MPYLSRPGATLFFDDTGPPGVPIITTHGFIENGSYWSRTGVSAALAGAGYRVVDVDVRGHGRSVAGADGSATYETEDVVADFDAVADALGFGRFHLLAHATGGMAACRYAIDHHHRLLSLVASDTASATVPSDKYASPEWDDQPVPPLARPSPFATRMAAMLREVASFNRIIADLRAHPETHVLAVFFKRFAHNPDPERCWQWAEDIYAVNNPLPCADFADAFYKDTDPLVAGLRQISCPTKVVVGEHDDALMSSCELLARSIPNSELVVLEGLGHMTAIEDPQRIGSHILSFLAQT